MRQMSLLAPVAAILLGQALPANAQQERDFPDGPGKDVFIASCGACHELNRARAGYTPEGWRTVVQMMKNVGTPVPPDQWDTLTQYLIKSFPERSRPAAAKIDGPQQAKIHMWQVPTPGSRPHDPRAAKMALSGTPASSPTRSAGSIQRPSSSRSFRSRLRAPAHTVSRRIATATSGSPATARVS